MSSHPALVPASGVTPMRATVVLLALIVLALAGCRIETPVLRSAKATQFESGRDVRKWPLTDAQLQAASDWLAERRSGWNPAPSTFTPSLLVAGIDVQERAFELNVRKEDIVLIGPSGQFIKRLPPDDMAALRILLGADQ